MDENDQVESEALETVEEEELQDDLEQDSDEEQPDDESQPEEEDEELDLDGQKYKIPKALKPLVMMQSDYTQKTQQLAEQRRAFEAQQAQTQQTIQQNIDDIATIRSIENRVNYLSRVDFRALSDNDPLQAQQLFIELQQLKETKQNVINNISQREQQRQQIVQQQQQQLLEQGNATLAKELPGWGKDMAVKIMTFAQTDLGFSPQELQQITDPRIVKALHAAMVGQQVLKKSTGAKPKTAEAKPVRTVGKGSPATKDERRMSTDDWMKARNAQIQKKRR